MAAFCPLLWGGERALGNEYLTGLDVLLLRRFFFFRAYSEPRETLV